MKIATLTICRKGFIPLIALVFFFIMANLAFAKLVTFVEEYTYQASEYDSKVSCRALALEQVLRTGPGRGFAWQSHSRPLGNTKGRILTSSCGHRVQA